MTRAKWIPGSSQCGLSSGKPKVPQVGSRDDHLVLGDPPVQQAIPFIHHRHRPSPRLCRPGPVLRSRAQVGSLESRCRTDVCLRSADLECRAKLWQRAEQEVRRPRFSSNVCAGTRVPRDIRRLSRHCEALIPSTMRTIYSADSLSPSTTSSPAARTGYRQSIQPSSPSSTMSLHISRISAHRPARNWCSCSAPCHRLRFSSPTTPTTVF